MGSRWTRIAVPLVGLSAVMAALAIVAGAPIVLFSDSDTLSALPAAPGAAGEVAQVTAPERNAGPRSADSPSTRGEVGGAVTSSPPAVGLPEGAFGETAPDSGAPATGREPARGGKTSGPDADRPSEPNHEGKGHGKEKKDKGHGKAKSKGKPDHAQGHAYGHDKANGKGNGKAVGHGKSAGPPVAFDPPHGKKQGHVKHPGAGKHGRGSGRSHARPRG